MLVHVLYTSSCPTKHTFQDSNICPDYCVCLTVLSMQFQPDLVALLIYRLEQEEAQPDSHGF